MAAREMEINIDQSKNIVIQTINIEALNAVQMQANVQIDRIKVEAAQALGSAEAVFYHMNESHEAERAGWYQSTTEY